MYGKFLKRFLDLVSSSILLMVLLPALLLVALVIKIESKGPVLFRQTRAGKNLKPFIVYKFRTMSTDAPKYSPTNSLLNANAYITKVGKILRKLSIDELPQLYNVVKGEMSMIGPRPVVLNETNLLSEREKYRANAVKPGITGWAQVNGRDEVEFKKKAEMDGYYASNLRLMTDAKCVAMTLRTVLLLKGYREGKLNSLENVLTPQRPRVATSIFYSRVTLNRQRPDKVSSRRIKRGHRTSHTDSSPEGASK